jgi:hypothetical protein
MRVETLRQGASWVTMLSLIMIGGLRAQADDSANSDGVENAAALDGEDVRATRILRIDAAPAGDVLAVRVDGEPRVEELGKYWIGVQINEVSPALRSQLNLEKDRGVLIGEVLPESPASKGGVKQHDILLAIRDQKVAGNEDVLKAVKDADGKELKLTVLRGGSERTLTVTPAERPKRDVTAPQTEGPQEVARWIENFQQFQQSAPAGWTDRNLQYNVVKPGQAWVFPGQNWQIALPAAALPEDLSISVTRQGKQPAKITIKQKERVIETTEDKLAEVPDDLRRYVDPMLGRSRAAWNRRASVGNDMLMPAPPGQEGRQKRIRTQPPGRSPEPVERRLEELERRFKELERSLDKRDHDGEKSDKS